MPHHHSKSTMYEVLDLMLVELLTVYSGELIKRTNNLAVPLCMGRGQVYLKLQGRKS
jgi:hypothetical protein